MNIRFFQKIAYIATCFSLFIVQQVNCAASSSSGPSHAVRSLWRLISGNKAKKKQTKASCDRCPVLADIGEPDGPVRSLFCAIKHNDIKATADLLQSGISPNVFACDSSESPLQVAARVGSPEMVKLLIDAEADVHYVSESGNALHAALDFDPTRPSYKKESGACGQGNSHLVVYHLIKAGIDVTAKNMEGESPMESAHRFDSFIRRNKPWARLLTKPMLVILQLFKENPAFEVPQSCPEMHLLIGDGDLQQRARTQLLSRALATSAVRAEMALLLSLGADAEHAQHIVDREKLFLVNGQTPFELLPKYIDIPPSLLPNFEKIQTCRYHYDWGCRRGFCDCEEDLFHFFVTSRDAAGYTPLHIAATVVGCDENAVERIITKLTTFSVAADIKNEDGLTPCELAVAHGFLNRATYIERCKVARLSYESRRASEEAAAAKRKAEEAERRQKQALARELCKAVEKDNFVQAEQLLEKGADINYGSNWASPFFGSTIRFAVRSYSIEMVKLLLGRGAKITDDKVLESFFNSFFNSFEWIKWRIEHGKDVGSVKHYGSNDYAKVMIGLLVDAGADVNAIDNLDRAPLTQALVIPRGVVSEETVQYIIKKLITAGADSQKPIPVWETPRSPSQIWHDRDACYARRVLKSPADYARAKGFHDRADYIESLLQIGPASGCESSSQA